MTDPRRLRDDARGLERAVLGSARVDRPSADRKKRLVAAATAVTATTVATTASGAAIAGKVLLGVACLAAAAVGYERATRDPLVATSEPASPIARAPLALPAVSAIEPRTTVVPSTVVSAASSSLPKPTAAAPASAAPSIEREIALVDEARAALREGSATRALAALSRYDAECAGGALSIEVAVLRIEARAASGDHVEAANLARRFIEAHPGSPYAARVKRFVEPR